MASGSPQFAAICLNQINFGSRIRILLGMRSLITPFSDKRTPDGMMSLTCQRRSVNMIVLALAPGRWCLSFSMSFLSGAYRRMTRFVTPRSANRTAKVLLPGRFTAIDQCGGGTSTRSNLSASEGGRRTDWRPDSTRPLRLFRNLPHSYHVRRAGFRVSLRSLTSLMQRRSPMDRQQKQYSELRLLSIGGPHALSGFSLQDRLDRTQKKLPRRTTQEHNARRMRRGRDESETQRGGDDVQEHHSVFRWHGQQLGQVVQDQCLAGLPGS